ncbi:hypothetical protein D043_1279B, partial [Vibrio parahaemolyticus EKP-021]
CLLDA